VLIVTHGGIIASLRKYLLGRNYIIDESSMSAMTDSWDVRNCSITEISIVGEKGPGRFVRMGAYHHLLDHTAELENSTGS
jgi:broad specificity phosphatase PhoE